MCVCVCLLFQWMSVWAMCAVRAEPNHEFTRSLYSIWMRTGTVYTHSVFVIRRYDRVTRNWSVHCAHTAYSSIWILEKQSRVPGATSAHTRHMASINLLATNIILHNSRHLGALHYVFSSIFLSFFLVWKLFTIYLNQFIECINIGRRVFVFRFTVLAAERWQATVAQFVYVFIMFEVCDVHFFSSENILYKSMGWAMHTHNGTTKTKRFCCAPQKTYHIFRRHITFRWIAFHALVRMNANRWFHSFVSLS